MTTQMQKVTQTQTEWPMESPSGSVSGWRLGLKHSGSQQSE